MSWRSLLMLASVLLVLSLPVLSEEKERPSECDKTKQKIRHIQSKMRSGYTRSQGEKMEAQLRKLREKRKKVCQ